MIVGMDFGTTNSGMAVYDGRAVSVLPLDPTNANPRVLRTALYITNEQAVHIGRAAVDHYYEHNIGRIVKTRKVWIGEIEVYAEDMYYVTDAYAWVDVSEPGRLMLSVKTRLREEDHPGAIVGQHFYRLEDLIALYLTVVKVRAEKLLGRELKQVVLGRPVHFSLDDAHDRLAQGRLLQAALRAGYETVYFQHEPVAAAFSYETTIDRPENVLVFDFGGGTLDITVMRLGDPQQRQVLATGGIPVAGDIFDQKLTRAKLPPHFGEGSLYGPRRQPMNMPKWIFDAFSSWQTIIELQTAENRRVLEDIARTAQRRFQIEALISLITSNYGLKMFDQVEQAKRLLSEKHGAEIRLDGPDFKVRDFVTRSEFERVIRSDIMAIEAELQRTVAASGLAPSEIDAVIRTGGSAQIPVFHAMLARHFGAEKVRSVDTFSSVTAGLGVIAHGIETGQIKARAYTAADVIPPAQLRGAQPRVTPVNLQLMQKRILMDAGVTETSNQASDQVLVALGTGFELTAVALSQSKLPAADSIELANLGLQPPLNHPLLAGLDEQLLLVTSLYRFLLTTPRQLLDMQTMGITLPDLHKFEKLESLSTLASWSRLITYEKMTLVTNRGFVRAYPLPVIRANIEAPIPLKFDYPLPGSPLLALGAHADDQLVLVSAERRGWRWPVATLKTAGLQAANCGKTDAITAAAAVPHLESSLLLFTADGYGRCTQTNWIPEPPKANTRGKALVARRSALVALGGGDYTWLLTTQRIVRVENGRLPLQDSTKTTPVLKLNKQEGVVGVLSV